MLGSERRTTEPVVALREVWKRFGPVVAAAGLDLDVPGGAFLGLVGPNGAGKTTALRMLTGLLRPDAGTLLVDGTPVWPDPTRVQPLLGVVPDGLLLFERLTGAEMTYYAALLRGVDATTARARSAELLDVLGLSDASRELVADYSHGMKKKAALAAALVHRPRLLVLDEPFEGIDPASSRTMRDVLARFRNGGGTVLFSSHVIEVVERLCDHVAVIAGGVIRVAGTIEEVAGARRLEDVIIELTGGADLDNAALSWLDQR